MLKQCVGLENASSLARSINSFCDTFFKTNEFSTISDSLRFRLYGQQCKKCDDERFFDPQWYKEEVERILDNVHKKIGQVILTLGKVFTSN